MGRVGADGEGEEMTDESNGENPEKKKDKMTKTKKKDLEMVET